MFINTTRKNMQSQQNQYRIKSALKAGTCNINQEDTDAVAKSCCQKNNKWACYQFEKAIAPRGCTSQYASCLEVPNEPTM